MLENQGIPCDQDGSITYVLDEDGHRTGEAYAVISIADTGEPISEQF